MALIDIILTGTSIFELKYLAILALVLLVLYPTHDRDATHNNAPTVGVAPGVFGRWKAPYRWMTESQHLVREGMLKYGDFGRPFKIRSPTRWMTFITNPAILNEMRALPLSILSYREAADELIRTDHTLYRGLMKDAWHIEAIRKNPQLFGCITETASMLLPEIVDEVKTAWEDNTSIVTGDGWTEVNPYEVMVKVISRTTNRVFVGLPLCRNQEYLDSVINFAVNVVTVAAYLDMTPKILQAAVARFLFARDGTLVTALKHVGPIFEERIRQMSLNDGFWEEGTKPTDVFQWIIEAAPPNATIRDLTLSLMFFNTASIHTTSITMTHALFDLAANPSYQKPLRDEMEEQLAGGWTSQALTNMKKTDSVLRESGRMGGINIGTVLRKAITSHTFSDGTHVTKGSWVMAPAASIHRSNQLYESPEVFDGLRAYNKQQTEGVGTRLQSTSMSNDYLVFGHGASTCPGRFFATKELKVMLAYVLCNYEFRLKDGVTERPENFYAGLACYPDTSVSLLFRHRRGGNDLIV